MEPARRTHRTSSRRFAAVIALALLPLRAGRAVAGDAPPPAEPPVQCKTYLAGDPQDVAIPSERRGGGLVLMGGGEKLADAMRWMIRHAGASGDFVALKTSDYRSFSDEIPPLGGVDSVEELVIPDRNCASDPHMLESLRNADAIFIAGGDQGTYVRNWQGTPVQAALNAAAAAGVPIGGTSAGLAILGEFSYGALSDTSSTAATALPNPYQRDVTLVRDFLHLPLMHGIITDTHFVARNRMGRLVTFLARLRQDAWVAPTARLRAIAVDEDATLVVETKGPEAGHAQVLASTRPDNKRTVYMIDAPARLPQVCAEGQPLTYRDLDVQRLQAGETFDLSTWTGGTRYVLSAVRGALVPADPY